jgi:hypothetical protein
MHFKRRPSVSNILQQFPVETPISDVLVWGKLAGAWIVEADVIDCGAVFSLDAE